MNTAKKLAIERLRLVRYAARVAACDTMISLLPAGPVSQIIYMHKNVYTRKKISTVPAPRA